VSARDDYQIHKVTAVGKELSAIWNAMCDEIDRLRRRLDLMQGIGLREVTMPADDDDDVTR